ncbi:hypothetical protein [Flavobacterium sp.]|uniref:hypothetical protein n=1 Tax=Flavobacterium sp. TaxID=239 RepID=UPI00261F02E7|nr:hypothetical protein [Flavobacterium sp.]
MNEIEKLKQAVAKLESDLTVLAGAEEYLSMWEDRDINRSDGSMAQDARHAETGRNASHRVLAARRQVENQKALVAELAKAI